MATDEEILVIAKNIRKKRKDVRVIKLAQSAAESALADAESRLQEET
jgi:Tfp pilus assembly protein PilX